MSSNVIPPLLCDTPPPMDYDDENRSDCIDADEFGDFETTDISYTFDDATENMKPTFDPPVPEFELPKSPIHIPSNMSQISESPDPAMLPECDQDIRYTHTGDGSSSNSSNNAKTTDDINLIFEKIDESPSEEINCEKSPSSPPPTPPPDITGIETCETNEMSNESNHSQSNDPLPDLPSDFFNENKLFPCDEECVDITADHYSSPPSLKLDSLNTSTQSYNSPDTESLKNEAENHSLEYVCDGTTITLDQKIPNESFQSQLIAADQIENNDHKSIAHDDIDTMTAVEFTADFSQFNEFPIEFNAELQKEIEIKTKIQTLEKDALASSIIDDNDDGDFDDFTEFSSCTTDFDQFKSSVAIVDNSRPVNNSINHKNIDDNNDQDVDDDFGDFSDFTQHTETTKLQLQQPDSRNVESILRMMFPNCNETTLNDELEVLNLNYHNDITGQVKNVENSIALNHQWLPSTGKSTLITALGIDVRNILYGGQWNSPMPRFAANLGFSPLEPMRSTTTTNTVPPSAGTTSTITVRPSSSSSSHESTKNSIDNSTSAVDFNWTSSGLMNPLDGIQEILHKTSVAQDQSTRHELNWSTTTTEPTILTGDTSMMPIKQPTKIPNETDAIKAMCTITAVADNHSDDHNIPASISSSYMVPGSGSLKETHIYTPDITAVPGGASGTTILASSTTSNYVGKDLDKDLSEITCPDFDFDKAAAGIIIDENVVKKEYRDVEYNPDMLTTESTTTTTTNAKSMDGSTGMVYGGIQKNSHGSMDILQPTLVNNINWLDDRQEQLAQLEQSSNSIEHKLDCLMIDNNSHMSNSKKLQSIGDYAKPVIGISPSDTMFSTAVTAGIQQNRRSSENDDDFSEFQSSITIVQNDTSTINQSSIPSIFTSVTTTVPSPSIVQQSNVRHYSEAVILTPQLLHLSVAAIGSPSLDTPIIPKESSEPVRITSNNSNINWPDPGINPNELARLEAMFTVPKKSQNNKTSQPSSTLNSIHQTSTGKNSCKNEEVEWTDFVSSSPKSSTNQVKTISNNVTKMPAIGKTIDDDDWSDFVSGSPNSAVNYHQPSSTATVRMSLNQWNCGGPNFPSWNAPPQFNSWQNSTIYNPPQQQITSIPLATTTNTTTSANNNHLQNNFNSKFMDNSIGNSNNNKNSRNHNFNFRQQQQQHQQQSPNRTVTTPSISLLPDLSFVAPKIRFDHRTSRINYPLKK